MTAMLEAALASLPEDVLARSLGFVRVEELARLSEVSPNARAALGDARRALWFGLFAAHGLRRPSERSRRAHARPRRGFFAAYRGALPNPLVLSLHVWRCLRERDSPAALARALPPPARFAIDTRFPDTGNTALLVACSLARARCVRFLVGERRADANVPNHEGWTCLCAAAWRGDRALVRWLVAHVPGLDLDAKGRPPQTSSCGGTGPFDAQTWATRKGFASIARIIERERKRRSSS